MKQALSIAAAILGVLASPAHAVNIANEGATPVFVVVTEGDDTREYEISGGEVLVDVCKSCSVLVNGDLIEAKGDEILLVSDDADEKSNTVAPGAATRSF